ncbi:MAG: ABC transporter substrate-binding protein [Chloroflexota bacterium]
MLKFSRRLFITLAASAALAACQGAPPASRGASSSAAGVASTSGALIPLKVAYTNIVAASGPQWVAKERGFFAKNGLDVTLASLPSTAQIPALMAGELQFASIGPTELASADLQGATVVALASSSDLPTFSLFAGKKYASVADLAGETVGVTAIGSSSDAVAHLFLSKFGVLDKVKITAAGGTSTTILAALKQGVIAGAILAQPTGAATEAGFTELVNGVKLGVPFAQGDVIVTRAYAKDHPDTVKGFLRAYVEAWRYCADPANRADMVKIFEKYTTADAKVSELGYDAQLPVWQLRKVPSVNLEAFRNTLSFGSDPKIKGIDPTQFFDNSFIDAVAAEQP